MKTVSSAACALALFLAGCGSGTPSAGSPSLTSFDFAVPPRPASTEEALGRLFGASKVDAAWFAPTFVEDASAGAIQRKIDEMHQVLGTFLSVKGSGDAYVVVFELGDVPVHARIDDQGRFAVLLLARPNRSGPRATVGADLAASEALSHPLQVAIARASQMLDAVTPDKINDAFSPSFLKSNSPDRIYEALLKVKRASGACRPPHVASADGKFSATLRLECERGTWQVRLDVNRQEPYRMDGFLIVPIGS
jgi:hypothetical protein